MRTALRDLAQFQVRNQIAADPGGERLPPTLRRPIPQIMVYADSLQLEAHQLA